MYVYLCGQTKKEGFVFEVNKQYFNHIQTHSRMFATLRNNTFGLSGPCNWRLSPTSSSGSWAQFQVGSTRGCPVAHYPPTAVTESSPHHAQCPGSNHSAKESTRPPQPNNQLNACPTSHWRKLGAMESLPLYRFFDCSYSYRSLPGSMLIAYQWCFSFFFDYSSLCWYWKNVSILEISISIFAAILILLQQ